VPFFVSIRFLTLRANASALLSQLFLPASISLHFYKGSIMSAIIYVLTVLFVAYVIYVVLGDEISAYIKNNFRH
jgi:hypothetical protein